MLNAKSFVEMLHVTFTGDQQFTNVLTYVFLLMMLLTIYFQVTYLAFALKYFDAMYVVPVFMCFWMGGSTLAGGIFFNEFRDFTLLQGIIFPCGLLLTIAGVAVLSNRQMTRVMEEDDKHLELSIKRRKSVSQLGTRRLTHTTHALTVPSIRRPSALMVDAALSPSELNHIIGGDTSNENEIDVDVAENDLPDPPAAPVFNLCFLSIIKILGNHDINY